jgi:PAS domain S-box-containing protein
MVPIGGAMSAGHPVLLRVEIALARILATAQSPFETYDAALVAIGEALGCESGSVWEVDAERDRMYCARTWQTSASSEHFGALSAGLTLAKGEGLPGRVWASGEPAWIVDAPMDGNFPRAEAARRAGLHAGFCSPLRSSGGVVGAIEFFARELLEPDEQLLASMTVLGSQIGEFVARRRAEEDQRASESRVRAMLESSLDAVVTMDHRGRVLEWNPAAEKTFGYAAADALGHDMAGLIVPPGLREDHRRGFAHYLETGTATMLDRRLEITGMRADGTEFPVELTITRINVPSPPLFTGYLRDITDRKRAVAELRSSRLRLVEAADRERRRLERNLHDGAQQHMVAIALLLRTARARLGSAAPDAADLLERAEREFDAALDELRELAQGIHPAVLTERGLGPALHAVAERAPVPVQIREVPAERFVEPLEACVYYTVAEALTNVAKHARATAATVGVSAAGRRIVVEVADDGVGGAAEAPGSGLRGLADRVEALGGTLTVESPAAGGTLLRAEIPMT